MWVRPDEVPIEFRRKALQHLESIRDTPLGPGAEAAERGEEACDRRYAGDAQVTPR